MSLLGKEDTGIAVGCSFRERKAGIGLLRDDLGAASGLECFRQEKPWKRDQSLCSFRARRPFHLYNVTSFQSYSKCL